MSPTPRFAVLAALALLSPRLAGQPPEPEPPPDPPAVVVADETGGAYATLSGEPADRPPRSAFFIFGGFYTGVSMGDSARVFKADYDYTAGIGLGYQRYGWSRGHFHFGGEVGVASRFGEGHSVEVWGGPTARYDGLVLARTLRVSPGITVGLSGVTNTMGVENERERSNDGDGSLLFYLGPEVAVSVAGRPNIELFYRLHHRSGAGGRLGGLKEGYNANVVGLRCRF